LHLRRVHRNDLESVLKRGVVDVAGARGPETLKVIEAVHQLRRVNGARQVRDAELALVSNAGSGAQHLDLLMLGRA
jgi:hypothetical protein